MNIKKKRNKRKRIIIFAILILFFIIISGYFLLNKLIFKTEVVDYVLNTIPSNNLKKINILAYGIDETEGVQRSDTIFLIHVDLADKYIKIYSIPRDTYIEIPGIGMSKVNHSFAYGKEALLQETLENFFNIRIDYYLQLNLNNLEKIFDKVGGIKIEVKKDMHYVDHSQNLFINLQQGEQVLTGKELIGFLRFRHDAMGDISRIGRQQQFLKAVFIEGLGNMGILRSLFLLKEAYPYLETNLNLKDQLALAVQINNIYKNGAIIIKTLSGEPQMINRVSYWIANQEEVNQISSEFNADSDAPNNYLEEDSGMIISKNSEINNFDQKKIINKNNNDSINLNILNGSGIAGKGLSAYFKLKRNGFKIKSVNYASSYDYDKTVIVDWGANQKDFTKLTKLVAIDPKRIIRYHNQKRKNEVTLIIGRDWININ
ncbi:MAG: LCP family protein [Candidatus Margulisiibacteriota bacterium]|jgi:LCP family protein required for cell wall assembly